MKKAVILLLAVLYISLTSGVMVNIHYCMGEVATINYGHKEDKTCGECGMDMKDGCCTTEHKLLKSNDEHLFIKSLTLFSSVPVLLTSEFSTPATRDEYFPETGYLQLSPPNPRTNHLRLFNGDFRI